METHRYTDIVCTECHILKQVRIGRIKDPDQYLCRVCSTRRTGLSNKRYSLEEVKAKARIRQTEWSRKNRQMNREAYNESRRTQRRHIKMEVLLSYGGCCACCGETKYEFLSIDHINGGGTKHRKEIGNTGHSIYQWLKINNYPEGFRVLCHNCNQSLGYHGYCPHN